MRPDCSTQHTAHSAATPDETTVSLLELQHHASVPQWTPHRDNSTCKHGSWADLVVVHTRRTCRCPVAGCAFRHAIKQPALRLFIRLAVAAVGTKVKQMLDDFLAKIILQGL